LNSKQKIIKNKTKQKRIKMNENEIYFSNIHTNLTTVQVKRLSKDELFNQQEITESKLTYNNNIDDDDINLSWCSINVKINLNPLKYLINKIKKNDEIYKERIILNNINGIIKCGEMLAVMGSRYNTFIHLLIKLHSCRVFILFYLKT
jgi:hypothetical protein